MQCTFGGDFIVNRDNDPYDDERIVGQDSLDIGFVGRPVWACDKL